MDERVLFRLPAAQIDLVLHPGVRLVLGERAIAHARAARLLEREGAGAERVALHLLHTEPAGSADAVDLLRAAAHDANARGAPDAAAT